MNTPTQDQEDGLTQAASSGGASLPQTPGSAAAGPDPAAQFAANLIHELRTPLTAIIGFAEMFQREVFGPLPHPKYHEYAKDIHDSGTHLLALVNEILELSKADFGKLELKEDWVDVEDAIWKSARMVAQRAQLTSVRLAVAVAPGLPKLYADERRLRQIVINLLTNAVKFTPPGGEVVISADCDAQNDLLISILDTGVGISQEDMSVAIAPFGQIGTEGQDPSQGTGLGLPLTKRLLEAHGGTLEILSTVGQGTIIVARFPAHRVLD